MDLHDGLTVLLIFSMSEPILKKSATEKMIQNFGAHKFLPKTKIASNLVCNSKLCWWIIKTTCFSHFQLDCSHNCGFQNVRDIMAASKTINKQLNESAKHHESSDDEETALNHNTLQKTPTPESVKHNNQDVSAPNVPTVLAPSPYSQMSATSRVVGFFQPCPATTIAFSPPTIFVLPITDT